MLSAWAIRCSSAATHSWMSASTCSALAPRAPLVQAEEPRAVGEVYGHVARRGSRATGSIGTSLPVSSRQIAVVSSSERLHSRPPPTLTVRPSQLAGVEQLALDQVDQVLDVEQVAHLLALAAEADVGERVAEVVGEHPVGEDALVDLAHLPGAGDHAAAVDHRRHAEPRPVLLDQQLGGELGGAVEGAGALEREVLGDAGRRDARHRLLGGDLEAGLAPPPAPARPAARPGRRGWSRGRRRRRRRGGPARGSCRRRSGWCGPGSRCRRRRRSSPRARPSTRSGRRSAAAAARSSGSRTSPRTNSTPASSQPRQVQLRAAPVEVVERDDLPVGMARGERDGEVGADEAGAAGDQEAVHAEPSRRLPKEPAQLRQRNWNSPTCATWREVVEDVVDERAVRAAARPCSQASARSSLRIAQGRGVDAQLVDDALLLGRCRGR